MSKVKFENDPAGREFDVVSDEYIAQTKKKLNGAGSQWRKQAKATYEAALENDKVPYFHFETQPSVDVIQKLQEYNKRYGVNAIIDISPL